MTKVFLLDDDRRQFVALERAATAWVSTFTTHVLQPRRRHFSKREEASLVVVTEKLSNAQGFSLAQSIAPTLAVVCSEALTSTTVFEAVGSGAYDCLAKPLEVESILALFNRLREERDESEATVWQIPVPENQGDVIVGRSGEMIAAHRTAAAASRTQATVLIRGESGTGKEVLAWTVHDASGRTGPFVALNCAAIVDALVERELFGYERGAFTGATERRPGAFEIADGGTLFLDEISDATSSFQAKLLRVLDCGEFFNVGGRSAICPDVRIVAATN